MGNFPKSTEDIQVPFLCHKNNG